MVCVLLVSCSTSKSDEQSTGTETYGTFRITPDFSEKVSQYDGLENFSEGLAAVEKYGKRGYIDKNGDEVIALQFSDTSPFHEGFARVGRIKSDKFEFEYGFIDRKGELVIPYGYDDAKDFSEGLAAVKKDGKWGFVNSDGEVVISFEYADVDSFSEGLAGVSNGYSCGFINRNGSVVIPLEFRRIDAFHDGRAKVMKNGKYGYIDKNGETVIPLKYDFAGDFSEGLAYVAIQSGYEKEYFSDGSVANCLKYKYGFINPSGEIVIPLQYDGALGFSDGLAMVEINEKYGYVDKKGKQIVPCDYDNVSYHFSDGLAQVRNDDVEGFINTRGEMILRFEHSASEFSEGLATISVRDKNDWANRFVGYMDKYGNTTLPEDIYRSGK